MPGFPCSNGTCVDWEDLPDGGSAVKSTRRPEQGRIDFDADEIVKFIDEVKAGAWDAMYNRAKAAVAETATA